MSRRIVIVSDAAGYVGPNLSRLLAQRGHDLIVGDPAAGLVEELEQLGAAVEVVEGVRDLRSRSRPSASSRRGWPASAALMRRLRSPAPSSSVASFARPSTTS